MGSHSEPGMASAAPGAEVNKAERISDSGQNLAVIDPWGQKGRTVAMQVKKCLVLRSDW